MDFDHSDDRKMLAASLGRLLQQHYPIETRHAISASPQGWSRQQWAICAELGVIGALFSEDVGGLGGTGFDIAVIFEQLGRALAVEPYLSTLISGRILAEAGGQDMLIGEIIEGATLVGFAFEEPSSHYDLAEVSTVAALVGDDWRLTGTKATVLHAETADHLLVSARIGESGGRDEISLFLLQRNAPGIAIRSYPMVDGGRGGELNLDSAPAVLVANNALAAMESAIAAGIVAVGWEAVGIMDMLKTATLEHLRTRKQFGTPIGQFQSLQHRMATIALEIEQARSAMINAADALASDAQTRDPVISAAKYTIGHVGTLVAEEAIQLHGGMGMAAELPVCHYAKRLLMIGHQLGDEDHHLDRFIALRRRA